MAPAARGMGHRRGAPAVAALVGRRSRRFRHRAPPAFDPACYLCPGNARVSGAVNPAYTGTFVFDNDHPCVGTAAPRDLTPPAGIYRNRAGDRCRTSGLL